MTTLRRRRLPRAGTWLLLAAASALLGCSGPRAELRPNILLITLDTTRADRIGCYGYDKARTPVLDQLAREGVQFDKAYSPIPLTLPAHASLMTGLYPPEHGLRTNGSGTLPKQRTTLAELLAQSGYDTGAFVASFVLDSKFGVDQGFSRYDDDLSGAAPTQDAIHRFRDGKLVVDAAETWLTKPRKQPFFCWVHLYDPHAPYDPRSAEFDHAFDDAPYDGEIAYTDRLIGRLLEIVRKHPETIVVVAGDHGEGLGDHYELQHGYTLYNATQHVPLIVHGVSDIAAGSHVASPVSLIDLFPTLLDLGRVSVPDGISGRNLTAAVRGDPLELRPCYGLTDDPFLQNGWSPLRSYTTDGWRYIRTSKPELYDLAADPQELRNLADAEPERMKQFEAELTDLESALSVGEADAVQLSDKEQKALAGLGYIGGKMNDAPMENNLPDVKDMLPFNLATQAAIDLMEAGKLEEAEAAFRKIVEESPEAHSSSRVYLGSVCEQLGRGEEAEKIYLAVLKRDPDHMNALFHLGGLYADQGRFPEALAMYERGLELEPDSALPHFSLGLVRSRLGEFDAAERHFEEALQIDPEFPGVRSALGTALVRLGRTEEAVAAYEGELELNPENVEAHANLAAALGNLQRLEESRRHLEAAARIAPRNPDVQFNLGVCLGMEQNYPAAVEHLQEALRLRPDFPGVRTALGNLLVKQKKFADAQAAFEEELKQSPKSLEARVNLGALLGQQEQWAEAIEHLEQAVRLDPRNLEAQFNLGLCYGQQGDLENAARCLEAVLRLAPDHERAAAELARIRQLPKTN